MKLVMSEKETLGVVAIFRDFYEAEKRFQKSKSIEAAEHRNLRKRVASMLPQFAELLESYLRRINPANTGAVPSFEDFYPRPSAPAMASDFNFPNSAPVDYLNGVDFEVESVVGGKNPTIAVKERITGMVFRLYPKAWPELPEMTICDEKDSFVGTLRWSTTNPYIKELPSLKVNLPNHIAFRNPDKIVINGDTCSVEFSSEPKQIVNGIPCRFSRDEFNTSYYVLDAMETENWFLSGDVFSTFDGGAWVYGRGEESYMVSVDIITSPDSTRDEECDESNGFEEV